MIHAFIDEVERNFACAQAGEAQLKARYEHVNQMPNILYRQFELSLLSFVSAAPGLASQITGIDRELISPEAYSFLGAGTEHTTLVDNQQPESVIKIHRASVHMTASERYDFADQLTAQHDTLRKYIGQTAIRQFTTTGEHPLKPGKNAVKTSQPKINNYQSLKFLHPYKAEVDEEALASHLESFPGLGDALYDLATNGLKLWSAERLLLDCSNPGNLVVVKQGLDAGLMYLDGLPAKIDRPSVIERIVGQLLLLQNLTNPKAT